MRLTAIYGIGPTQQPVKRRSLIAARPDCIVALEHLLRQVGAVNPYHPLLVVPPTPLSSAVQHRLVVAREMWDEYRSHHLPNQIAGVLRSVVPELIRLIVDYAC